MELGIDRETARSLIVERINSIRSRELDAVTEFSTPTGFHLAELSATSFPDGSEGSTLRYRTAMISPVAANARRKSAQIRDTVKEHRR